jgi:hypothetical protein
MTSGWGRRADGGGRSRISRSVGCLLWLAIFVVILVALSVLFGGFQLGTKTGGTPPPRPAAVSATARAT